MNFKLPDEYEPGQLDQLLASRFTFMVEPPIAEKWTLYDTFDWRLFNRSLVLRHADQKLYLESFFGGEVDFSQ